MVEASLLPGPYGTAEPAVVEISGPGEGAGWRFWQVTLGKSQFCSEAMPCALGSYTTFVNSSQHTHRP